MNLSYLGFELITPSPVLRPFVQSYWRMKSVVTQYHEEFMHPEGEFGMVFNLGDDVLLDSHRLADRVTLDGSNTVSRKMGFFGGVDLIGIRFYPGGAYPFFGLPLYELANEINLLDVLDRSSLTRLYQQLGEAKTVAEKVEWIERWLLQRLSREPSPVVLASLDMMRRNQSGDLYISQRQLERLYKTQVGFTPVQYARLLRVKQARNALKLQRSTLDVGMELGFYDQSHFIRDFKSIVGMTPLKYMQRSLEKREKI